MNYFASSDNLASLVGLTYFYVSKRSLIYTKFDTHCLIGIPQYLIVCPHQAGKQCITDTHQKKLSPNFFILLSGNFQICSWLLLLKWASPHFCKQCSMAALQMTTYVLLLRNPRSIAAEKQGLWHSLPSCPYFLKPPVDACISLVPVEAGMPVTATRRALTKLVDKTDAPNSWTLLKHSSAQSKISFIVSNIHYKSSHRETIWHDCDSVRKYGPQIGVRLGYKVCTILVSGRHCENISIHLSCWVAVHLEYLQITQADSFYNVFCKPRCSQSTTQLAIHGKHVLHI